MTSAENPGCELYLVTPVVADASSFLPLMERALDLARPSAVRLRLASSNTNFQREQIALLCPAIQKRDIAVILEGLPALARETGCDGAHVSATDIAAARTLLGEDLQLGASCGTSRDEAMTAGESGADYISFGPASTEIDEETSPSALAEWWVSIAELPVVTEISKIPASDTPEMSNLQKLLAVSDFLAVGGEDDNFWKNPENFVEFFENFYRS